MQGLKTRASLATCGKRWMYEQRVEDHVDLNSLTRRQQFYLESLMMQSASGHLLKRLGTLFENACTLLLRIRLAPG